MMKLIQYLIEIHIIYMDLKGLKHRILSYDILILMYIICIGSFSWQLFNTIIEQGIL